MQAALAATAPLWPAVAEAFAWVYRAAHVLGDERAGAEEGRRRLDGLLGAMRRHRARAGPLAGGLDHFVKVTRSYRPGLFAYRRVAGLERTNNALEQAFGSHRYHERRATGRKGASPALVLRGAARLVAGLHTRHHEVTAADLASADPARWRKLRAELEVRRERRAERYRFRKDPEKYLRELEAKLSQSRLPA